MKIIKFGAGWCKPCKRLQTVLDNMETPYPFECVDIEQSVDKSSEYGIRMVPTLILVDSEGVEQRRLVGLRTQTEIEDWLSE
ncbi:MAG: thioredoxin family protein [Candidatus Poseidoniaceae archaeon]